MNILLTGSGGMLGRQLLPLLEKIGKVVTIGIGDHCDLKWDMERPFPDDIFRGMEFDTVVHAAGTCRDDKAIPLNLHGTEHLLSALSAIDSIRNFIYVSCYEVYSPDAGEKVAETHPAWATTKTGQSKALAETKVHEWAAGKDIAVTIVRPARMFGPGVGGPTLDLFNEVVSGRYIHIRGNEAKLSLVASADCAEAIVRLIGRKGIFNISDGYDARLIDLAEAMSENIGAARRMTYLPQKWADNLYRLFGRVPLVDSMINPEKLKSRSKTLTLDNSRVVDETGIEFRNTLEYIRRPG